MQALRAFFLTAWAWAALGSMPAHAAEPSSALDIQHFAPSPFGRDFFTVESAACAPHLSLSAGLFLDYGHAMLRAKVNTVGLGQSAVGDIVDHRLQGNLMLALGLLGRGELGVVLPVVYQNDFDTARFAAAGIGLGPGAARTFGVGDLRLVPKAVLYTYDHGLFGAALVPEVRVPTGGKAPYIGEAGVTFAPRLALSSLRHPWRFGLDVGANLRRSVLINQVAVGNEFLAKAAAAWDVGLSKQVPVEVVGEVILATPLRRPFSQAVLDAAGTTVRGATPLEAVAGLRLHFAYVTATLGGGGGLVSGYGAPVPRVFASAIFYSGRSLIGDRDGDGVSDDLDKCPDSPEDPDGFEDGDGCPELDNDHDGVLDEDDNCPDVAEDADGFADEDGCPDPDNDADGVPDADDRCPNQAEDRDGFRDDDGCPDPDNDGDGVPDASDRCPTQAEDNDGFEDGDGCPDPDNDGDGLLDLNDQCPNYAEDKDGVRDDDGCPEDNDNDGVVDAQDKCPTRPETYNGYLDPDGCPDRAQLPQLVRVTAEKIELKQAVVFTPGNAAVARPSLPLLAQLSAVLRNYRGITLVRIEAHTDDATKLAAAQLRATAVRNYLVQHGIAAERLQARGVGPGRLPRRNGQNRLEIIIVTQYPDAPAAVPRAQAKPAAPPTPAVAPAAPTAPGAPDDVPLLDLGSPAAAPKKSPAPAKRAPAAKPDKSIEFNF